MCLWKQVAAVEWSAEENYMFRLSAFRTALVSHILASPNSIYPPQYRSQVLGWLGADAANPDATADLEDISISRPASRLSWGVPVPQDPTQTVYVWFDALLIYLSGVGYPWRTASGAVDTAKMHASGWPADVQVVGKDILRFHALYLPAILLALNAGPHPAARCRCHRWPCKRFHCRVRCFSRTLDGEWAEDVEECWQRR